MKPNNLPLFLVGCLLSITGWGQTYSLPDALQRATLQNRGLQATAMQSTYARTLVGSYRDLPKTNFELQYGNIQTPYVGDYMFTIGQNFENRSYYRARKGLLESQIRQAEVALSMHQLAIRRQVREAYHEWAFQQLLADFLTTQDSVYRRAARRASLRHQTGEGTLLEKVSFETQQRHLENRIKLARLQAAVPYQQLKNLLTLADSVRFTTSDFYAPQLPAKVVMASLPAIQQLEAQRATVEQSQLVEKALLRPSYQTAFTNQSMLGSVRQFVVTGGVSIPIFKDAQKARLAALSVEQKMIDAQLEATQWEIENQTAAAWSEWRATQAALDFLEKTALPQAELLLQTATKLYEAGESNYLEFQQSYQQAAQFREDYLRQRYAQKRAEAALLYLMGQ